MGITSKEIKVGSLLEYCTAEGDIITTCIGWKDLKWIDEDPVGFNAVHSPIVLNDVVLVGLGFSDKDYKPGYTGIDVKDTDFVLTKPDVNGESEFERSYRFEFTYGGWPRVKLFKYVHHLQMFFSSMYGVDL